MQQHPFYDPMKSYEDNYSKGPFGLFSTTKQYVSPSSPPSNFLGHTVNLPFGIPAGPLLNQQYVKAAFDQGFDIATYKTVRSRQYPCHPWPNVLGVHLDGDLTIDRAAEPLIADKTYQEPIGITNSFGVPSMDPDYWQPDMVKAVAAARPGQVMIGSFQGTTGGSFEAYVSDYVLAARLTKETGAKILEANLSCPNEGKADLLCFDVERTTRIAYAIKEEIGSTPLILKFGYYTDDVHLRQMIVSVGKVIDGIAAINTISATVVDHAGNQALPGEGRARSGVCGAPIKWAGLSMVNRLHDLRQELGLGFSIIGVGGVTTPNDYDAYRNVGADVVMSATGAMWHPDLAQQIKERK